MRVLHSLMVGTFLTLLLCLPGPARGDSPKISGSPEKYIWKGTPVNISCEVEADPEALVVWFRDGLQLPHASTSNVKIYNTSNVSYLEVNPVQEEDFGAYNCTATNVMGSQSKTFHLFRTDLPLAPDFNFVEPSHTSLDVYLSHPDYSGGGPVLKYKVHWRLPDGDWMSKEYAVSKRSKTTIDGLKPGTEYEIKLSAISERGEGESSEVLTFSTLPVMPPSEPRVRVGFRKEGNAVKLSWAEPNYGGSPITHYMLRYRPKPEWESDMRLHPEMEYVVLANLPWNTEYEFEMVAWNERGASQPAIVSARTAEKPTETGEPRSP